MNDRAREVAAWVRKSGYQQQVIGQGVVCGMPYYASVMRPLVRRGLFDRIEQPGFQVRWQITQLGLAVRRILEETK